MIPAPLNDYQEVANQTALRAAAAAAAATRKSSGTSSDRKNGLQPAEPPAATARGEASGRSGSVSSTTASNSLTAITSTDTPLADGGLLGPAFSRRNGRKYLRDASILYPLPYDLTELHRQTLRTMLFCQVFNGPICSPAFRNTPPKRILEIGCGTGFWSVMCHRHFAQRGFPSISFTGLDIAPIAANMDFGDMDWRFVQHDLRRKPLPFPDQEFNFIMLKDLSMVTPGTEGQQSVADEYIRLLKPGGSVEVWDGDHSIRMLLHHTTPPTMEDEDNEDEYQTQANAMGIYTLLPQTPLVPPQNQYLNDYNLWISKALEARKLSAVPSTIIRPVLLQEYESLTGVSSRRLAIPLGEVRWEREGVGGAVTPGADGSGKQELSSKDKGKEPDRRQLTPGQAALRRTALMTVVQMIESLEPVLREASGKSQDEWDRWYGSMMSDLLNNNGTAWGECLEVGAWWARRKKSRK